MKKLDASQLYLSPLMHYDFLILTHQLDWLKPRYQGAAELLRVCTCDEEFQLMSELLKRFTFVTETEYKNYCNNIHDSISGLGLPVGAVAIAPLHNDHYADSSKRVLYDIKVISESKRSGFKFFDSAFHPIYQAGIEYLFLVDDFSGSGDQAKRVIQSIQNAIKATGKDILLSVKFIAAMEDSPRSLTKLVDEVTAEIWLKKGISGYNKFSDRKEKLRIMHSISGRLAKHRHDGSRRRKLYPLGYKDTEALFKCEPSTIPNNVFPIFYWGELQNGEKYKTILP